MEYRVFPQPKRGEPVERSPAFGKRQGPPDPEMRLSRSQVIKATGLCLGAAVLGYLVVTSF